MPLRWPLTLAIVALMAVPASAADQSITANPDDTFKPADVTIDLGDTVTWHNDGGFHNVHFDDGSFEDPASPDITQWTVERKFDTPGVYRFYCEQHGGPNGTGMSGKVSVRDASGNVPKPVSPGLTVHAPDERGLRRLVKKGLRVRVACENGCDLTLKLSLAARTAKRLGFRRRRTTIGTATASTEPATTQDVDIALTGKAKRRLAKTERAFKVRLDVRATRDTSEKARRTIEIKP